MEEGGIGREVGGGGGRGERLGLHACKRRYVPYDLNGRGERSVDISRFIYFLVVFYISSLICIIFLTIIFISISLSQFNSISELLKTETNNRHNLNLTFICQKDYPPISRYSLFT